MLDAELARDIAEELLDRMTGTDMQVALTGGQLDTAVLVHSKPAGATRVLQLGADLMVSRRVEGEWVPVQASSQRLDEESLERLLQRMESLLEHRSAEPAYQQLPYPDTFDYPDWYGHDAEVERTGPVFRFDQVARLAFQASRLGLVVDGRYAQTQGGIDPDGRTAGYCVVSSRGVFAHNRSTTNQLSLVLRHPDLPDWGDLHVRESIVRASIDGEKVADEIMEQVGPLFAQGMPGRLAASDVPSDVVWYLDRPAVASLVGALLPSFSGHASIEGHDYARLGRAVFDPELTLQCDVSHDDLRGRPFDVNGIPTQTVTLVGGGKLGERVWSLWSGRSTQREPTGHSLSVLSPQDGPRFPVMSGTEVDAAELLAAHSRTLVLRELRVEPTPEPLVHTVHAPRGGVLWENGAPTSVVGPLSAQVDLQNVFAEFLAVGKPQRALGTVVPSLVLPGEALGRVGDFRGPTLRRAGVWPGPGSSATDKGAR